MTDNALTKKVEDAFATFNALPIQDKKFVRGIISEEQDRIKFVMKIYNIDNELDADIKLMTTLARSDIKQAMDEINALQISMFEASILHKSEAAVNKIWELMDDMDTDIQLKAATQMTKLGMEVVKEKNRKSEGKSLKVIIENPSGEVNINVGGFSTEQVGSSFIPKGHVVDAEIVEEERESYVEEEKVDNHMPNLVDENGNKLSF